MLQEVLDILHVNMNSPFYMPSALTWALRIVLNLVVGVIGLFARAAVAYPPCATAVWDLPPRRYRVHGRGETQNPLTGQFAWHRDRLVLVRSEPGGLSNPRGGGGETPRLPELIGAPRV